MARKKGETVRETKAVSVRFGLIDYGLFQSMSKRFSMPWTDLIKSAVEDWVYLVKQIADGWQIKLVRGDQEKILASPKMEKMAEHLQSA